jgi:5-methylcytosine-specific restriction endonuclease McrA
LKTVLDNSSLKAQARILNFLKIPKTRRKYRLYDIDHIIPVSSGGGGMNAGLNNLRTLCMWCHEEVTKAYNRKISKLAKKKNK